MSAEVAVYVEPQQGIDVERWANTLVFAAQLAEKVHDTEFVPKALRGRPEAVAATIMYGAEVGVTPMQALAGIHIVDGRPSPSAELMRAMILRAGHSFTIHEMTGTRARVSGLRRGRPESERVVVDWSLDMARAAGLLGKQNWRNYPRAMLVARAFGDLARVAFPDVVKGLGYVAEDVGADELDSWQADGSGVGSDKPRKPLQRKQRRRAPEPADDPQAAQSPVPELPPVAPPSAPVNPPKAAASPARAAGEGVEEASAPVAPEPDGPVDTVDEIRARYDDELARREQAPELSPEVVGDALAEHRAETLRRHKYADDDARLPDELQPENLLPEQTPPEPPVAPGVNPEADSSFRAMQAGLTAQLGTVATREERHGLVSAILGKPIESTKDLSRADRYRVLDALSRFADGSASWDYDIATGGFAVHDDREPPEQEGGSDA